MIIKRTEYIDKIKPFINKPIIKVLIGPRRSGKQQFLNKLLII